MITRLTSVLTILISLQISQAQITNRIYTFGNSVTDGINFAGFQAIANQKGNTHVLNRHMIPGSPLFLLYNSSASGFTFSPYGYWPNALANYDWDCISFQPFDRGITGPEGDFTTIQNWINYLKANRPTWNQVQIYIYSRYPRVPNGFTYQTATASMWNDLWNGVYPGGQTAETKQYFIDLLNTVRGANLLPKQAALIPAGDVMQSLNQKMVAGSVPGYNSIWDFYADGIHVNNVGSFMLGATFFATMYKQDPRGLIVPNDYGSIPDGIRDIILQTIYEVVFTHPYSGTSLADIVAPTGVTISPKTANLSFLQSVTLQPTVAPANASNKNVSWTSNNTSVATVDTRGKVTGVGSGVATITGTTNVGSFTDFAEITVTGLANFTSVSGVLIGWDFQNKPNAALGFNATQAASGITTLDGVSFATIGDGLNIRADGFGDGCLMGTDQTSVDLLATLGAKEYFSFKVKPAPTKLINIKRLRVATKSEGGQHVYALFSSVKGFTQPQLITTIVGGFNTMNTITIVGHENLSTEVEFRLYVYSPTANQYAGVGLGAVSGNDIELSGDVVSPVDTELPATISGLNVSQITDNGFFLSWNETTDNMIVMGYNVYLNGTKLNQNLLTGTSLQVSSLTSGLVSNITVTAVDFVGNESLPAAIQTITNRAPVAVLTVDRQRGQAPLTIQVNGLSSTDPDVSTGDFVLGYDFNFGDGSPIINANSATHTYTAPGVYTLSLAVVDTRNLRSNTVSLVINVTTAGSDITPPSVPTGLTLIAAQSTSAQIAWANATDNVSLAGYNVYLLGNKLNTVPVPLNLYTITGLIEGQSYVVSVTSIDASANESLPAALQFSTNRKPNAAFTGALIGAAPFTLSIDATSSSDPDAGDFIAEYLWTVGGMSYSGPLLSATLNLPGIYHAALQVKAQNNNLSTVLGFAITVTSVSVSNLSLLPNSLSFPALQSRNLTAIITPSNATNQLLTWVSSNPSVASVSAFGRVNGLTPGVTTITASSVQSSVSGFAVVTISAALNATVSTGTLAGWDFGNFPNSSGIRATIAGYVLSGVSTAGQSGLATVGSGVSGSNNLSARFGGGGFASNTLEEAITNNDFISFRIAPTAGNRLNISSVQYAGSSQNSTRSFSLLSNKTGFTSSNALGTFSSDYWCCATTTLTSVPISNLNGITDMVEFRVYIYGATGSFDDVNIGPATGFDFIINGSVLTLNDTQSPTAPGAISVTGVRNTQVVLNWTDATDDIAVSGYNIYRNGIKLNANPINGTFFTLTGLTVNSLYPVTVTAVDVMGNESAPSVATVQTNQIPIAVVSGTQVGVRNTTFTFTGINASDADDAITQYQWTVNGGAPYIGTTFNFIPTNIGTYTISLVVTDSRGGQSVAATMVVTVLGAPDVTPPTKPGTPSVVLNTGSTVVFSWSGSFDLSTLTYSLVVSNGTTITSNVTQATLTGISSAGTYQLYIIATDAFGNRSAPSDVFTLTGSSPTCSLTGLSISIASDSVVQVGDLVTITSNLVGTAWQISGLQSTSDSAIGIYKATQAGSYIVKGIYSDALCSFTSSVSGLVWPIDSTSDTTSIQTEAISSLRMYPNPSNDIIYIEGAIVTRVAMINSMGALVKEFLNDNIVSVADLPSGIYNLVVYTTHKVYTSKVVKQ